MALDGVDILTADLPVPIPVGQAGVWFRGPTPMKVLRYEVSAARPKAFVAMQFTEPYDQLYEEVIEPVCRDLGIEAFRATDQFGPGVIIQDIERQIVEARIVIADITPANLNVYYEVGYAHALRKDTILIAEKPTNLPFDVSAFRVLFYENTIAGKKRVDAGLRRHLQAILDKR